MEQLTLTNPEKLFHYFRHFNILIIGDVMIDAYLFGSVERISPEAPVPVVSVNHRTNRLGGAANVALNVKAMGANPILFSVIGEDDKAALFYGLMEENKLPPAGILKSKNRITTTKFRVIGNNTQMLRVDEEMTDDLCADDSLKFRNALGKIIASKTIDAIIFQDYDKGVITPEIIDFVTQKAAMANIPVTVDPKKDNFSAYRNVTLFKPNLKELGEGLGMKLSKNDHAALREAVEQIHTTQNALHVMVTLSEEGVFISEKTGENSYTAHHLGAHLRSIADVSGAGDTVISVATLALAAGLPAKDTATISNLAGGLVCEYVGVVPIDRGRLMHELSRLIV
jgi:D-glycero-beta-D-manno-heptose-7-phosphate kinase